MFNVEAHSTSWCYERQLYHWQRSPLAKMTAQTLLSLLRVLIPVRTALAMHTQTVLSACISVYRACEQLLACFVNTELQLLQLPHAKSGLSLLLLNCCLRIIYISLITQCLVRQCCSNRNGYAVCQLQYYGLFRMSITTQLVLSCDHYAGERVQ